MSVAVLPVILCNLKRNGSQSGVIENLTILQKVYDFEKQMYGYLKKYPQSEKFALVTETKNTIRLEQEIAQGGNGGQKKSRFI